MCSSKRHSYLFKSLASIKDFNPKIISRALDKELYSHTTYRNLDPPFLTLSSSAPSMYCPNTDGTRAKIAFGRLAWPKLKKQIHYDDITLVMQALNSIHDLVHNPEKAFEAIRIGIVDRLTDIMMHERDIVREKICLIFYTIAGIEAGKRAIIQRYKILHNLAMLIEDKVIVVRQKAQLLVEVLSLSPVIAVGLNNADFIVLILRLIGGSPNTEDEPTLILHLGTLKMLLDRDVKELALKHNAMNILIKKMDHGNEKVKILSLDCIALLCQVAMGRAEGKEKNLGFLLCKKLFDPSLDVKIKVASALAFSTIQSDTRGELCKKCTIEMLVELLENFQTSEGQLMAAKVLSNLSEDPKGRKLIQTMKNRIINVYVSDNEVDRHKKMLINLLKL